MNYHTRITYVSDVLDVERAPVVCVCVCVILIKLAKLKLPSADS